MAGLAERLGGRRRLLMLGGLALVVFLYLRRGTAAATGVQTTDLPVASDGSLPATPTAATTASGDLASQLNDITAAWNSRLDDLGTQVQALGASAVTPADLQAAIDQWTSLLPVDSGATVPPDAGPSGQTPPAAPGNTRAATAAGFWWGGKWIQTPAQLLAFERSHGNSGFNLALWAAQHPTAAIDIGVKPPPPPPPRPTRSSAGAKVTVHSATAVRPSAKTPAPPPRALAVLHIPVPPPAPTPSRGGRAMAI